MVKGSVSFVSIIGLPGTGKSTLMNLILNNEDEHPVYNERVFFSKKLPKNSLKAVKMTQAQKDL